MSRNMIAITLAIAVLSGVVIGHLTAVDSPSAPRVLPSDHRLALVRDFYDGMNAYLQTGDEQVLELLAPGFQDHGALGDEPASADALLARLDRLRLSMAVPTFRIEELHDLGQVVQVRLSTGLPGEQEAARFSVTRATSAGPLEFLQLQGDAIVTRWAQDDLLPIIDTVVADTVLLGTPGMATVEVNRVSLDPGAHLELGIAHDAWIVVEQGSIKIDSGLADIELSAGEMHASRQQVIKRISNRSGGTSSFWFVGVTVNRAVQLPTVAASPSAPAGVTVEARIGPSLIVLPAGHVHLQVELALLTISPGTQLIPAGNAIRQLVGVSEGAVEVSIQDGELLHTTQSGISTTIRERQTIAAGEGVAMLPDASATYRATGAAPADLFLMTISQID